MKKAKRWAEQPAEQRDLVVAAMCEDFAEWVHMKRADEEYPGEAKARASAWGAAIAELSRTKQEAPGAIGGSGSPLKRGKRKGGGKAAQETASVTWMAVHERTGRRHAFRRDAPLSVCTNAKRPRKGAKPVAKRAADCLNCERGLGIVHNPSGPR